MEKKTALQQAIELMKQRVKEAQQKKSDEWELNNAYRATERAYSECLIHLTDLLPTERQQLEDAWNDGNVAGEMSARRIKNNITTFEHYYTTYKTT